jgi:hypothetical protein
MEESHRMTISPFADKTKSVSFVSTATLDINKINHKMKDPMIAKKGQKTNT